MAPTEEANIESDNDEDVLLSYTLNLQLMQLPGSFLRRVKSLGTVTIQAMELFEDEDSVGVLIPNTLGMLNDNALSFLLARIEHTVGFKCSAFEYSGSMRGAPAASSSKIMVSTWADLDKCLEFIEDYMPKALDVDVIPICSFVFFDEGESSRESFRLDCSAHEITWDWISKQIKQITGADFACSYVSTDKSIPSSIVSSQLQLDELLDHIFAGLHNLIRAGARAISRDDFIIHLRLVPVSSQVTVASVPAGLPGAVASTALDSRSTLHVDLACVVKKDGKAASGGGDGAGSSDTFSFGGVLVSASQTFAETRKHMQALVAKKVAEYEKASSAKGSTVPPALQDLPASVREGKSLVVAFIYRRDRSEEEMKLDDEAFVATKDGQDGEEGSGEEAAGEEAKGKEAKGEEDWKLEDSDGLFGFKVDTEDAWARYRARLMMEQELQARPVSLVLAEESRTQDGAQGGEAIKEKAVGDQGEELQGEGKRADDGGIRGDAECGRDGSGDVGKFGARAREPLKQVVIMCYDGDSDPTPIHLKPPVFWRDLRLW
jgi:hypothetical protein